MIIIWTITVIGKGVRSFKMAASVKYIRIVFRADKIFPSSLNSLFVWRVQCPIWKNGIDKLVLDGGLVKMNSYQC
jgi:hypothetical protein